MAYVSVDDPTQPNTSPVNGVFGSMQVEPVPSGYIGWIDDNDPRIQAYYNSIKPSNP